MYSRHHNNNVMSRQNLYVCGVQTSMELNNQITMFEWK